MNRIYRSIWNESAGAYAAVSELAPGAGKKARLRLRNGGDRIAMTLKVLAASVMLAVGASAYALPAGGVVSAGSASVGGTPGNMVVTQSSQNAAINWQSFSIAAGESVNFVQPGSSAVALNRVIGPDPTSILGNLSANGKVFLVNPNGILFGTSASVNVAGLVASSLNISDADFVAGRYKFSGAGNGAVTNQGNINADGGYVALLGKQVANDGVISARLGSVALASGEAMTLDLAGDKLLNVQIDQGAVNALVQNGGMIQADGGLVLMTTQAAGSLLSGAVNNTGTVLAQTISSSNGTIRLLGGAGNGAVDVGGTLDASAPGGGNGGTIETSAARVKVQNSAAVTAAAPLGTSGTWTIAQQTFTVGTGSGDSIAGATLSNVLVTTSVTIGTSAIPAGAPPGTGDITVNDAVSWTASKTPTTLTLNATGDVILNNAISATKGNVVACCGRDINVDAPITTVNGSVLLSAARDVNLDAALTTTDGNVAICAANDIRIGAQITLTRGSSIPAQSLGLPLGLLLNAGFGGGGPGMSGGTVVFDPLAPPVVVTGPNAPVTINYNPTSYTTPTDFLPHFTLTDAALTQHMLVFASGGDKGYDGTTATTLDSLKGNPAGVTLLAGPGSTASFDSADAGAGKTITFTGYTLGGPNAGAYALPTSCCGPIAARTTGTITAAAAGSSLAIGSPTSGGAARPGATPSTGAAGRPGSTPSTGTLPLLPGSTPLWTIAAGPDATEAVFSVVSGIAYRSVTPPSTMVLPPFDAGPPLTIVAGPAPLPPVEIVPAPVAAPPVAAPPVFVQPVPVPVERPALRKRPRKQDRN